MPQSLLLVPVILCEEEDLYFIVALRHAPGTSCSCLPCLPASVGSLWILRPGVIHAGGDREMPWATHQMFIYDFSFISGTTRGDVGRHSRTMSPLPFDYSYIHILMVSILLMLHSNVSITKNCTPVFVLKKRYIYQRIFYRYKII